jgi:hypothetical protein
LIVDYPNGDKAAYIDTVFRGRITGGNIQADGDEILDVRYFSKDEVMRVPHSKWLDTSMPVLFTRDNPPHFIAATWKPGQ